MLLSFSRCHIFPYGNGSISPIRCLAAHATIHFVEKKTINTINASSRNLWVSGLSSSTRATDLKQIFSKYGKVIGAKVVTNARTPGARCYGYVTMSTSEDATKCIQHLHRTELHGRVISVEKVSFDLPFHSDTAWRELTFTVNSSFKC